jgi:hypothetical protein
VDSEGDGCQGCPERTGVTMVDSDWLTQELKQAEREYQELPESARPVVITSVLQAESRADADTGPSRHAGASPQPDGRQAPAANPRDARSE